MICSYQCAKRNIFEITLVFLFVPIAFLDLSEIEEKHFLSLVRVPRFSTRGSTIKGETHGGKSYGSVNRLVNRLVRSRTQISTLFEGPIMAAMLESVYHPRDVYARVCMCTCVRVCVCVWPGCLGVTHGKQFQPNVVSSSVCTHTRHVRGTQSTAKRCFVITGGDSRIHRVSIDQRPIDTLCGVFPTDSIVSPRNYGPTHTRSAQNFPSPAMENFGKSTVRAPPPPLPPPRPSV